MPHNGGLQGAGAPGSPPPGDRLRDGDSIGAGRTVIAAAVTGHFRALAEASILAADVSEFPRTRSMSQPAEKITGKPAVSLKDANFVWEDPLDIESDLTAPQTVLIQKRSPDLVRGHLP